MPRPKVGDRVVHHDSQVKGVVVKVTLVPHYTVLWQHGYETIEKAETIAKFDLPPESNSILI